MTVDIISSPLPMWDSFEAIFFVVAGLSVGIVLGVLFPSLWRSFRRGFRKGARYAPPFEKWDDKLSLKIKVLPNSADENFYAEDENTFFVHVFEAFYAARYYFQLGNARKAIGIYIEILTFEKVSKQDTNRALFELSQVYAFIGLYERAFDTALELLKRKPHYNHVMEHLLKISAHHFYADKFNLVLQTYKGSPDAAMKRSISHNICIVCEQYLKKSELSKAIDYARLAVKWDRSSARPLTLLWETTSRQFWKQNIQDKKIAWLSFATDLEARLQICITSKVSPAAGAEYLSELIKNLIELPDTLENYEHVKKEFHSIFNWEKITQVAQKKLCEALFFAVVVLQKEHGLLSQWNAPNNEISASLANFLQIIPIISNKNEALILQFLNYQLCQEPALLAGTFAHHCGQCHSVFSHFLWQCQHCGLEESLMPIMSLFNSPVDAVS